MQIHSDCSDQMQSYYMVTRCDNVSVAIVEDKQTHQTFDSYFGKGSKLDTSFLSMFQMIVGPNELIFTSQFPLFEYIYIFTGQNLADLPKNH